MREAVAAWLASMEKASNQARRANTLAPDPSLASPWEVRE